METHSEFARGGDLGRQQIARPLRMQIQVIGARRASGEREFGQTHERAHVHGFLVDRPPQRVQRLQPTEQRLVGHRRIGAREVLVDVMVGVHQTRCHQTVGGIDHFPRLGRRLTRITNRRDESIGDGHPATAQLAPLVVHGGDEQGVLDQQVGGLRS